MKGMVSFFIVSGLSMLLCGCAHLSAVSPSNPPATNRQTRMLNDEPRRIPSEHELNNRNRQFLVSLQRYWQEYQRLLRAGMQNAAAGRQKLLELHMAISETIDDWQRFLRENHMALDTWLKNNKDGYGYREFQHLMGELRQSLPDLSNVIRELLQHTFPSEDSPQSLNRTMMNRDLACVNVVDPFGHEIYPGVRYWGILILYVYA